MARTKWRARVLMSALVLAIGLLGGCEDEQKEECRIYVTDSTPNDSCYISALYVVENPKGYLGEWGPNILNGNTDGPYGWQQYSFAPGTYDYRIEYYNGSSKYLENCDVTVRNKRGLKFDMDGKYLFMTNFTFD
jgi:hypothetical protein